MLKNYTLHHPDNLFGFLQKNQFATDEKFCRNSYTIVILHQGTVILPGRRDMIGTPFLVPIHERIN